MKSRRCTLRAILVARHDGAYAFTMRIFGTRLSRTSMPCVGCDWAESVHWKVVNPRMDPTNPSPTIRAIRNFSFSPTTSRQKDCKRERPSETPRSVSPPSSEWRGGTGTMFPQHDCFLDGGDGAWCRKPNVECAAASLRGNGWAAAANNATVGRLEI
jgi:hypothetical protein